MNHPFRKLITITALLAMTATACGSDDEASTADTAGTDNAPAATDASGPAATEPVPTDAAAAFPVTVTHALGTTTIEAEPQRVVTVGVTEQDTVLAVGVTPVGVTDWYGDQPYATWPWAQDELGDAQPEVLLAPDGLDFESIAALEPDLIIGTNAGLDEVSFETLSAIAPTIAHPEGSPLYFGPWDDQARLIGEALGKSEEMEAVIADIDAQFAAARAAHPEFEGVSAVFLQNAFYDNNAIAYQQGLSTEFLTDLGFTIPASLDEFATEGGQAYIPIEQLAVLDDADVLLWGTENPEDRTNLEAEPLYNSLQHGAGRQARLHRRRHGGGDLLHQPAEPAVRPRTDRAGLRLDARRRGPGRHRRRHRMRRRSCHKSARCATWLRGGQNSEVCGVVDGRDRQRVEQLVDVLDRVGALRDQRRLPSPAPAPDHTPIGHQPRCNVSTAPDHASPEPLSALTTNVTVDSAWMILLRPAAVAALTARPARTGWRCTAGRRGRAVGCPSVVTPR